MKRILLKIIFNSIPGNRHSTHIRFSRKLMKIFLFKIAMKFLALVVLLVVLVLVQVQIDLPMTSKLIASAETGSVRNIRNLII